MAKYVAYNASHHYVGMGIKGQALAEDAFAKYLLSMRVTNFESGNNIESEDDEGHTGGANLNMGKYRTKAESEPSWEDKLRFKEGLEDIFYLLLGTYLKNPQNSEFDFGTDPSVTHYKYYFPPVNAPEPPACTIYNGYAKTLDDARVFNNAYLSQLEINMSNEEAPTIKLTFVSDYNNFNLANPTRNYLAKTLFVKPQQVNIYYGDPDLSLEELFERKLGCFMEASITINKNFEQVPCQDSVLGRTNKYMGKIEPDGSFKLPWNDKTRKLEPEYEGGNVKAHSVTEENIEKQIAYEYVGTLIEGTNINYRLIIHFPLITLTKAESPLSGDDVKDLTIEYEVPTKPEFSFMTADIWTDLEELHIDNEGCTLDDLFYVEPVTPEPVPNAYDLTFAVTDGTDPIESAIVTIGALTGTTDSTGNVTIQNVPEGSTSVSVEKENYTTHTDTINVTESTTVNITLTAS